MFVSVHAQVVKSRTKDISHQDSSTLQVNDRNQPIC